MYSRFDNRRIATNDSETYEELFEKKGVKSIRQYGTPKFRYPSVLDRGNFESVNHIWGTGDKFYKLAAKYYDDPSMWWVIAFYNQKPTEFHLKLGDLLYIPIPLETVLFYIGY